MVLKIKGMIIKNRIEIMSVLAIGVLMITLISCSEDETQDVTGDFNTLVNSDEFNIDGLPDSNIWSFDTGVGPLNDGWGNNELQYYTDRPENVTVQDGMLVVTANEEDFNGSRYTSARLKTRNRIERQFGRFEARILLPTGTGLFPAFWMLGSDFCEAQTFQGNNVICDSSSPLYEPGDILWPNSGEIDIMEYIGDAPTEVFGTVHGPGFSAGESISKGYTIPNDRFDTGFHVFGITWTQNSVNWYVDDAVYSTITRADVEAQGGTWVFDKPFYILINLAVGGNLPGSPDANTVFPQTMLVDYVRIYE